MRNAQKPAHIGLFELVDRIRDGRYVIPDFQRKFVWDPSKVRDLMRSVFLDYYVGTLLLWKGKSDNFKALSCESIQGYDASSRSEPKHIVLDGQQRLSALHYAFMAPRMNAPGRRSRYLYFIRIDRFLEEAYDDAFVYSWGDWGWGSRLLEDREEQFRTHCLPLAIIGESTWSLDDWCSDYRRFWENEERQAGDHGEDRRSQAQGAARMAAKFADHVKDIYRAYQVTYIELDDDLAIDKVCDIFQKINSTGQALDIFDLLNAILRPKDVGLKELWRQAEERLSFVGAKRMNVYVLQVMSILTQDGLCSPKYLYYLVPGQKRRVRRPDGLAVEKVHVKSREEFEERWTEAVAALETSMGRLRAEYGVVSSRFLPYPAILPAFAGAQREAQKRPEAERMGAQRKISQWYWASVFTQRYSSAVESTAAGDYRDLGRWYRDDREVPRVIGEFRISLRELDLHPIRPGSAIYSGVVNLTILEGAKDWIDGGAPIKRELDDHHIVPKAWGRKNGAGDSIDSILNRTPLDSTTNREVIRDRLPNEYLPELIEKNGRETLYGVLASHLIPPEAVDVLLRRPFSLQDFEEFLERRQEAIRSAIGKQLPESTEPPRQEELHRLENDVRQVEIGLRRLIERNLGDPAHPGLTNTLGYAQKRIDQALRDDPSLDRRHLGTLAGRLEFCDLRELEAAIVSKPSWPTFRELFGTQEDLRHRFHALAAIRNALAHSRPVTRQNVADAEAAFLWFKSRIGRST